MQSYDTTMPSQVGGWWWRGLLEFSRVDLGMYIYYMCVNLVPKTFS